MRTPSSALPAAPYGLVEGFGRPLPFFLATSFTTFLDFATVFFAAFLAGFAAFFFALAIAVSLISPSAHSRVSANPVLGPGSPLSRGRAACASLLLQLALRIEIADAARFAA